MIYNHKSDSNVQDIILDDIAKLTDDIESEYDLLRRYDFLIIYSPAFLSREILGIILDDVDDVWVHEDAHLELLSDDDNEVLITIAYDGMIFVDEARYGENLKNNDSCTLTYVYDGFSKKDIDYLSSDGESVLVFGFDDDVLDEFEYYEIEGERVSKEEFDGYTSHFMHNEKPDTTSTTKSTYKINGKECSKEEYEKALNELDDKYLDNVQDMLLNYFDFVSEMNHWRKLLGW